ncbi:MAG: flagellin lysine-N-methylase [Clostridium sp.]
MNNKVNKRSLNYFKEFKCIGGRCEDSCCIGWDVDIDKDTFLDYKKVQEESMKEYLMDNIQLNNECEEEELDYGKVKLKEGKRCPFLDGENYCIIHSNLGEGCLSNVCTVFPRVINKVDGVYEYSLDVACIEAARIILLKEREFEIEEKNEEIKKIIINNTLDTVEENWLPTEYFYEIRKKSLEIIKDKNISINKRLYVLGEFIDEIENEVIENYDGLKEGIENFSIENREFPNKDERENLIKINLFKEILEVLDIEKNIDRKDFKELTKRVLRNYESIETEEKIRIYEEFEENYVEESCILKNYLINYIFSSLFPFSEIESIFDSYLMLIVKYEFIKFYLIGLFIEKELKNEEIIFVIQKFSKEIGHHKTFNEEILEYLKENEFDNIAYTRTLLSIENLFSF